MMQLWKNTLKCVIRNIMAKQEAKTIWDKKYARAVCRESDTYSS